MKIGLSKVSAPWTDYARFGFPVWCQLYSMSSSICISKILRSHKNTYAIIHWEINVRTTKLGVLVCWSISYSLRFYIYYNARLPQEYSNNYFSLFCDYIRCKIQFCLTENVIGWRRITLIPVDIFWYQPVTMS